MLDEVQRCLEEDMSRFNPVLTSVQLLHRPACAALEREWSLEGQVIARTNPWNKIRSGYSSHLLCTKPHDLVPVVPLEVCRGCVGKAVHVDVMLQERERGGDR